MQIIIVSKDENSHSIKYIIEYFKKYKIFLIAPKAIYSKYSATNLVKINDGDILKFDTLRKQLNLDKFGWYFQQFLKYECVLKLNGSEFMIIDGDTVVDSKLAISNTFFSVDKRKVNSEYNNLYKKLFPNDKLFNQYFISNQMVFQKHILLKLVGEIESNSGLEWKLAISNVINKDSQCTWFSEYQSYANYALNRYDYIKIKPIKIFRRFDLIDDAIENGLQKYSIISFENHHKSGFLRIARAKIYYSLNIDLG